jgi:uncharacterized protein
MNKEIEIIKKKILPLLKKRGVTKAGIFGSYARGEQTENSDVDILIEMKGSLLDVVNLEIELREIIQKKVDLLTYGAINKYLKEIIINDEVKIL